MKSKVIMCLMTVFTMLGMSSCGYERVDAGCAKNAAIQKAQKAQNELAVVKAEAEKKVVAAQAEAEANRLRTQALTPMILKQQWIDKWDGKLPVYGSLPTLFKGIE